MLYFVEKLKGEGALVNQTITMKTILKLILVGSFVKL
jgi:hypothetical protein